MRKALLFITVIFVTFNTVCAQPSSRQKMIHMAAVRIADEIKINGQAREDFIVLYQNYKKESADILSERVLLTGDVEKDTEEKILSDFEKSRKILELRRSYYMKFRAILSPTMIQQMYDAERAAVR